MKSISTKILKTILIGLSVIVVLMTVASFITVTRISGNDSKLLMTQMCENETLQMNSEFSLLENSVTTISEFVREQEEDLWEEDLLTDEFCSRVQAMALSIANRTDGAMAVYFRYDPQLTGTGTGGFFWSRTSDDESFSRQAPTDILRYSRDDTEHVGWFYEPKENQKPLWMEPYYNKNLDVYMISYVIPYYTRSGTFLGVIGMDIDFTTIIRLADRVSLYETGKSYVADLSYGCRYAVDQDGNIVVKELSEAQAEWLAARDDNSATVIALLEDGGKLMACSGKLLNGMNLLTCVPVREINAERNYLMGLFAVIMIAAFLISAYVIARLTNRIVYPLKILTRITGKYAKGNWDETYVTRTGDEIQQLSESISVMAETTKSYIDRIQKDSVTDDLTGLKNKNCYLETIRDYQDGVYPEYSLVVFDINFLKKVNDGYGHSAGDRLIQRAGQVICGVFQHSPVFRIGGDEFVAILKGPDHEAREDLCGKFETIMKTMPAAEGGIPFSVSYGVAVYPADGAGYDEVFRCADERMYEYKKAMKAERE